VPLLAAKGATEERLQASSMIWTVLRPDTFMDVWIPMVVGARRSASPVTLVRDGSRVHSLVAVDDVAAYAVAATTHSAAENAVLTIGGLNRFAGARSWHASKRSWTGRCRSTGSTQESRYPDSHRQCIP
jgi:uncharacterized protein YbjT (DUF2867 family)